MPRKSPTTGAKPHRDDHQSYVAEDIWHWIKDHQNTILLVLTILIAGTVIYVMRSRASQAKYKRAQQALGQILTEETRSENSKGGRIKRIKSHISKYGEIEQLAPWFKLYLADAYYLDQRYDQAIQTLNELRETHSGSPAAEYSSNFLKSIRQEKSFVRNDLERRKKKLQRQFRRKKLVYGIKKTEDSSSSGSSDTQQN